MWTKQRTCLEARSQQTGFPERQFAVSFIHLKLKREQKDDYENLVSKAGMAM